MIRRGLIRAASGGNVVAAVSLVGGVCAAAYYWYRASKLRSSAVCHDGFGILWGVRSASMCSCPPAMNEMKRDDDPDDEYDTQDDELPVVLEISVPFEHTHAFFGPHRAALNQLEYETNTEFAFHAEDGRKRRTHWLITGRYDDVLEAEQRVKEFMKNQPPVTEAEIMMCTAIFLLLIPSLSRGECFHGIRGQLTLHVSIRGNDVATSVTTLKIWGSEETVAAAAEGIRERVDRLRALSADTAS